MDHPSPAREWIPFCDLRGGILMRKWLIRCEANHWSKLAMSEISLEVSGDIS